jgi:molybdate transport system substrate-binding protein
MTKVEAGEVDVGVVYRTDVYARRRFIQAIPIPPDQNVVATYPVATLTADGRAFVAFVLSDEGQAALAAAGFGPPG